MGRFRDRFVPVMCIAACAAAPLHAAQTDPAAVYPSKPIRFIVPFAPGGGSDATARALAQKLGEKWGQQVVVDNRSGASGAIGVDATAKANPDGYTICIISASNAVNAATNPNLPFDLTKDLQAVSQATSLFYVLYHHPSVPVKSVKELIAYAKAHPAKLNFGASGTGSLQHFAGELFNHMAGIQIVHVPFKGSGAVVPAMLANEVQVAFGAMFAVRPQVQAERLRWIAITAPKRSPIVDLPTIAESGLPGYEVDQWYGIITSAKVPRPIVHKLSGAIAEALKTPELTKRLAAEGAVAVGSTPEQFGPHIKSEIAKWKKLVKQTNLQLQ